VIWYGGGKLAAVLSLPKLRARWARPAGAGLGAGLGSAAARAVLRRAVTLAAKQARDEPGFFAGLREAGVRVRLRFSEADPGQLTGYSVTLPGHVGADGAACWYGGGRLAADLTLPQLRRVWEHGSPGAAERSGAFRFTGMEREAIYAHAAGQAVAAVEHLRRCARGDPAGGADAAWAAADALHAAAQAVGSPALRRAAAACDRAARAPYGQVPCRSLVGDQLRAAARMVGLLGTRTGDSAGLVASLAGLAGAVAELRLAQRHAAQAAAARAATEHLHAALRQAQPAGIRHGQRDVGVSSARPAAGDFAARRVIPVMSSGQHEHVVPRISRRHRPPPRRRAGPAP